MRYGLLLLGEHKPARLVEVARLATLLGYHSIWYADERYFRDTYVGLTVIALQSQIPRLGVCTTDPYSRHPALTAVAMASLAELSPGRAILGIGAGSSGFEAMGIDRIHPVAAVREAVALIRSLWAGDTVDSSGDVVSFKGSGLDFKAPPDTPVVIVASGPQLIALAGEIANGVIVGDYASSQTLAQAKTLVERGARNSGRTLAGFSFMARMNVCLSEDGLAARNAMRSWVAAVLWNSYPKWDKLFDYSPRWESDLAPFVEFIRSHGKARNVADYHKAAKYIDLFTDQMVADRTLAGTPNQVASQLSSLAEMGVDEVVLYPSPLEGQSLDDVIRVFAREVMPGIRPRSE